MLKNNNKQLTQICVQAIKNNLCNNSQQLEDEKFTGQENINEKI